MRTKTILKSRLYPILGFFLAIGAPGGLLLFRALIHNAIGSWDWIYDEVSSRALTYGYIAVTTTIIFVGLGSILGANEDLLRRMASTDPLTGLVNRRIFDLRLREELARADRYHQPVTLMILDLDGLKDINDELGHDAGDSALKAVARSLQRTCRATDLPARFGGDEFCVLAPNIMEEAALKLAERIRLTLSNEASWVDAGLPPLTVSIGITDTGCIDENHPDKLYLMADRALLNAKQSGKNRVVLASVQDAKEKAEPVSKVNTVAPYREKT